MTQLIKLFKHTGNKGDNMRSEKVLKRKLDELLKTHSQNQVAKMLGYTKAPTITYWKKIGRIPYTGQVAINKLIEKGE